MNFGNYDLLSGDTLDSTGDINVTCDSQTAYIIKLSAGENSNGNYQPRKLLISGGGATLSYNFYRDSSHTEVWGDGTNNTYIQQDVGTGSSQSITCYGRISGGQKVPAGIYQDNIVVTLEF